MEKIIITTPEELKKIIEEIFAGVVKPTKEIDTLSLDGAVKLLNENGYVTSKAKIYKMTSANIIPYSKFDSRLVFSRKALLEWAKGRTVNVTDNTEGITEIVRSANHKRRKY